MQAQRRPTVLSRLLREVQRRWHSIKPERLNSRGETRQGKTRQDKAGPERSTRVERWCNAVQSAVDCCAVVWLAGLPSRLWEDEECGRGCGLVWQVSGGLGWVGLGLVWFGLVRVWVGSGPTVGCSQGLFRLLWATGRVNQTPGARVGSRSRTRRDEAVTAGGRGRRKRSPPPRMTG